MNNTTLFKTVFLAAKQETVWAFLTNKDKLGEWYHPADDDLSEGNDYTLFSNNDDGQKTKIVWGYVKEMDPYSKLVTTFCITPFAGKETVLTWSLESVAGGTLLSLAHDGIEAATGDQAMHILGALDKGWDDHFARLRAL